MLTVAEPLARSAIDAIEQRFVVGWARTVDGTVLTVDCVDQAAVRAVMTMLWDSGHDVIAMQATPGGSRTQLAH